MILSLLSTKGGTGKSTVAHCLAFSNTFAKAFRSIALVELDPQGTLRYWLEDRPEEKKAKDRVRFFFLADAPEKELAATLAQVIAEHDAVILDVPGESLGGFATSLALHLSAVALISIRPSRKDEKAFFKNLLPLVLSGGEKTQFSVVPNYIHPNTRLSTILDFYTGLLPEPVKCLPARIAQRPVFENYDDGGLTLLEYARSVQGNKEDFEKAKIAAWDMEQVAKEVLKMGAKK